jgi:DNA primase large subunit
MYPAPILEADVKIFRDSEGVEREVLMSYEQFRKILEFIESVVYFDSETVQERLRKSDQDLQTGRYIKVKAEEVDRALEWLNE